MQNEFPTNLSQLNYEDMFKIARQLTENGNIDAAAHIVRQMVKRWPERVLNGKNNNDNYNKEGGDSDA